MQRIANPGDIGRPKTPMKKNNHKYVELSPCKCGNTKFKYIKIFNKYACSRCKRRQEEK